MHRPRSLVLVPALLLAGACSRGDDAAKSGSPLDRDLTLSAQLQGSNAQPSVTPELASGSACVREATPRAPTASQRAQAVALEQRAAEAEFTGNIRVARDLHRQAAKLDGTSEEIAYRLARAEEASGDSVAAVKGYCRYLAMAPSAANAKDVRARLTALLPSAPTRVAAQAAVPTPSRPVAQRAVRVSRAAGHRSSPTTYATVATPTTSTTPTPRTPEAVPPSDPVPVAGTEARANDGGPVSAAEAGEVEAGQTAPVAVEPPSAPPSAPPTSRSSTDHMMRNAAIGAAAGAAVGAMSSRSVKGAVIGGVAGSVLGAVVGRASRSSSGFRTPGWAH